MKLVFRVDCNAKTGFGHLSRVISLCRTWVSFGGLTDYVFIGNYNEFGKKILSSYSMPYVHVETGDFSELNLGKLNSDDVVLIDSYLMRQSQLDSLVKSGVKVILIDDECLLNYIGVYAVINFRFNAEKLYSYNSEYTFLGVEYLIVKPELVELRASKLNFESDQSINNILLFFGGGFDDSQFISGIIKHINSRLPEVVIMLLGDFKNVRGKFNQVKSTPHFHKYLVNVDALINAGGLIKYEASYSLIPTGSFSTSPLQYEDSKVLSHFGVHSNFGLIEDSSVLNNNINFNTFLNEISVRKELYQNAKVKYHNSPTLNLVEKLNKIL
tara:strand:+ start:12785 stop:13765 length:981 start_codon:yes stop_codon:yes gene_type:complete